MPTVVPSLLWVSHNSRVKRKISLLLKTVHDRVQLMTIDDVGLKIKHRIETFCQIIFNFLKVNGAIDMISFLNTDTGQVLLESSDGRANTFPAEPLCLQQTSRRKTYLIAF